MCAALLQYQQRILFMHKPIDEEMGNQTVATMLYLDSESRDDISMYINCSGGDVSPCSLLRLAVCCKAWNKSFEPLNKVSIAGGAQPGDSRHDALCGQRREHAGLRRRDGHDGLSAGCRRQGARLSSA